MVARYSFSVSAEMQHLDAARQCEARRQPAEAVRWRRSSHASTTGIGATKNGTSTRTSGDT